MEAVPLHVQQLEGVLEAREGLGVNVTDPVHAKIDPPWGDGLECVFLQFFNVIVIQVEIIDCESIVEHIFRHRGDKVFTEI